MAIEQVSSKANFTNISLSVNNSRGGIEVTIGDTIDLNLTSAANRGLKAGTIDMRPSANDILVPMRGSVTYNMDPLQTLRSPVRFSSVLFVSRVTQPDQEIPVTVRIDGETYNMALRSRFEGLIGALVRPSNERVRSSVLGHVVQFMRQEWNDKKEYAGDGFDDNTGRLLVERLANVVLSLPPAQQRQIRELAPALRSAYGERPGFFSGYQSDWDSAMKILTRAGL